MALALYANCIRLHAHTSIWSRHYVRVLRIFFSLMLNYDVILYIFLFYFLVSTSTFYNVHVKTRF